MKPDTYLIISVRSVNSLTFTVDLLVLIKHIYSLLIKLRVSCNIFNILSKIFLNPKIL